MNGLGFAYHRGAGVERNAPNYTKALRYFEEAAAQGSDADSMWNAGKMHLAGEGGANASGARGIELYRRAAAEFGHFDAVMELGRLHQTGYTDPVTNVTLVARSCGAAAQYLRAAAERGSWSHALRAGFDAYLGNDVEGAALRYAAAAQLGYSVAASNAAFLLHFRTSDLPTLPALHGYGVELQGREQRARARGSGAAASASARSARNGLRVAAARYYAFAARADQTPCAECEMRVAELQLAHLAQSLRASSVRSSFLLFAHLFFCLLIYSFVCSSSHSRSVPGRVPGRVPGAVPGGVQGGAAAARRARRASAARWPPRRMRTPQRVRTASPRPPSPSRE